MVFLVFTPIWPFKLFTTMVPTTKMVFVNLWGKLGFLYFLPFSLFGVSVSKITMDTCTKKDSIWAFNVDFFVCYPHLNYKEVHQTKMDRENKSWSFDICRSNFLKKVATKRRLNKNLKGEKGEREDLLGGYMEGTRLLKGAIVEGDTDARLDRTDRFSGSSVDSREAVDGVPVKEGNKTMSRHGYGYGYAYVLDMALALACVMAIAMDLWL